MAISQERTRASGAGKAMLMGMMLPGARSKPEAIVGMRRKMNQIEAGKGEEAALKNVRASYDRFVNWAFHEQIMSGSSEAINRWRGVAENNSRLWSKLVPKSELAAESIASVLERRGPKAAASWLFGASLLGSSAGVAKVAESLKERSKVESGNATKGWQSLRAAMWARLLSYVRDSDAGPSAHSIADTVTDFVKGRGSPVASVLYSPKEKEAMRRFANTLRLAERGSDGTKPAMMLPQAPQMLRPVAREITGSLGDSIAPQWTDALLAALSDT